MQQISRTSRGQKFLKKLDEDEIKKLDAEQIAAREMEEMQKERKETLQKLKSQEKKVDYLERAKRSEEIPLVLEAIEEKTERAKRLWEQQEAERIRAAIEERNRMMADRERLAKMQEAASGFLERIMVNLKKKLEGTERARPQSSSWRRNVGGESGGDRSSSWRMKPRDRDARSIENWRNAPKN
ncbi:hypothetical protein TKK_0018581 [Trichogramma kaykai]